MNNKKLSDKEVIDLLKKIIHSNINYSSILLNKTYELKEKSEILTYIGLDKEHEEVEEIISSIKTLSELTCDTYSQIETIIHEKTEKFFLKIHNAYELTQHIYSSFKELKKDLNIEFVSNYNCLKEKHVCTNDIAFKRIMKNFLENAYKHSKAKKIVLGAREKKEEFEIYVQDNGKGIDKKYHDKIFEGQRIKNKGNGTGLQYNQELSDKINARITLESTPGVGSVFSLYLRKI